MMLEGRTIRSAHRRRAAVLTLFGASLALLGCSSDSNGVIPFNDSGPRADGTPAADVRDTTGKTLSFIKLELDKANAGKHAQIARSGDKLGIAYLRGGTGEVTCPRAPALGGGTETQTVSLHKVMYLGHDGNDWAVSPVVATDRIVGVPNGISLAMDDSDNVYIGHLGGELGFFVCNSSDSVIRRSRDGGKTWDVDNVFQFGGGANSVADTAGLWTSVALDCDGAPQASFREIGLGGFQTESDFFSSVWVYGMGEAITSRPVLGENLAGLGDGEYNQLLFTPDCKPVAMSYDADPGEIKVAVKEGDTWTTTKVARGRTAEQPGFATDGRGTYGLAYFRDGDRSLRLLETQDVHSWGEPQLVDLSVSWHGTYASLAYDSQGNPGLSYYRCATTPGANTCEASEDALMFAYRRNGSWKTWEVDTGDEWFCGRYTSLVFTADDRPFIAYECTFRDNINDSFPSVLKVAEGDWK